MLQRVSYCRANSTAAYFTRSLYLATHSEIFLYIYLVYLYHRSPPCASSSSACYKAKLMICRNWVSRATATLSSRLCMPVYLCVCVCKCASASTSALPADWISDNVRTYFVRVDILCLRPSQFLSLPVLCVP